MDDSHVLLKTYTRLHKAEFDLNKLKNEGIDAYLSDKTMGSIGFLNVATGGVKMHVAPEDLDRAKEILSDE